MTLPLRSMTGFGAGTAENGAIAVMADIKSVNQRGLRLAVRSRPALGILEKRVRDTVQAAISRGSVDVTLAITCKDTSAPGLINREAAAAAALALKAIAQDSKISAEVTVSDILRFPGVLAIEEFSQIPEQDWPLIEQALKNALAQFMSMREEEGKSLVEALLRHVEEVQNFRALAITRAPLVVERTRERLTERLKELRGTVGDQADAAALEREVMFFADRTDIAEEIDRLDSHIAQFRQALSSGGEVGKRLEFLGQEMFREINTIASKANDKLLTTESVTAKLAVEKIKEQAANVE